MQLQRLWAQYTQNYLAFKMTFTVMILVQERSFEAVTLICTSSRCRYRVAFIKPDINVIGNSSDTIRIARSRLSTVEHAATKVGITINQSKIKSLVINPRTTIDTLSFSSGPVDFIEDFCYLGSWIRKTDKIIVTRKVKAWAAANKLRDCG